MLCTLLVGYGLAIAFKHKVALRQEFVQGGLVTDVSSCWGASLEGKGLELSAQALAEKTVGLAGLRQENCKFAPLKAASDLNLSR